jgi:RNA-directed DNA polymerase
MIFVFDRDKKEIRNKLQAMDKDGRGFQTWGNNVYSFVLPLPAGRSDDTHAISIEFLYNDTDIIRATADGRRLYLSNEFSKKTGHHLSEDVHCCHMTWIAREHVSIIDNGVFSKTESVALSKTAFANAVAEKQVGFADCDHSGFKPVFDIIEKILTGGGGA